MIQFKREIIDYLRLPSIPLKEWDGKSSFKNCVAVVLLSTGYEAYVVASFDAEKDKEPRVVKVFSQEPFSEITKVFIVPQYMDVEDIKDADLDDESKKRAEELAKEAKEIEDGGIAEEVKEPENEYWFDHIHSDEEAASYIAAYNKANKMRGKVPKTHEGLVMRLSVIYAETNKK
jgi:hypothetical protein